ncbi:TlyA family RNA methyltransferase [Rhodoferax sp.]|uniref:TlyA family RNA methyltransferase n=1 Tax=Rhodoferax sp. TaxID=50421 RepID=UPI00274B7471|nr:TlyA family RNA methyltransferase [Rhodoferax sp.]
MRADQLLLQRGLASSRSQAQRLISAGVQWREQTALPASAYKRIGKNSDELPEDAQIELLDSSEARYVSRGGLKLEGALLKSGLVVTGKTCLDLGQSTGGFTDCLLQHGATRVVGVDVGSGQLHPQLRQDARVLALEGVNARYLDAENFTATGADELSSEGDAADSVGDPQGLAPAVDFDLIVGDLAFISQTLVLPACVPFLRAGGAVLMLVKPQFELQPGQVGKGGIVRDDNLYAEVEQRIRGCYAELGLSVQGWYESPILGGDGNREFFVFAEKPQGVIP